VVEGFKLPQREPDLDSRFDRALLHKDLAAARRQAESLVAVDGFHVTALVMLELMGEDPRRLAQAGLDLFDLVGDSPGDVARTRKGPQGSGEAEVGSCRRGRLSVKSPYTCSAYPLWSAVPSG